MSKRDRWFRVEVDGVAVVHVLGWKEAQQELKTAKKRHGARRVRLVEETP